VCRWNEKERNDLTVCIGKEETEKVVGKREKLAVWKEERRLVDLIVKILHGG